MFVPLAILGSLMLMISVVLGLASVEDAGLGSTRQVGFAHAPNWGFVLFILFPIQAHLAQEAVDRGRALIVELVESGVLVTHDRQTFPRATAEALWMGVLRRLATVTIVFAVVGVMFFVYQWWTASGRWLLGFEPFDIRATLNKTVERDWTIGALLQKGKITITANLIFSLLCHLYFVIILVINLSFFAFCYLLVETLRSAVKRDGSEGGMRLVHRPLPPERLFGLKNLESILSLMLLFGGLTVLIQYCMRLQSIFLHSSKLTHVADVVADSFRELFAKLFSVENGFLKALGGAANTLVKSEAMNDKAIFGLMFTCLVAAYVGVIFFICSGLFDRIADDVSGSDIAEPQRGAMFARLRQLPFGLRPAFEKRNLVFLSLLAISSIVLVNFGVLYLVVYLIAALRFFLRSSAVPAPAT